MLHRLPLPVEPSNEHCHEKTVTAFVVVGSVVVVVVAVVLVVVVIVVEARVCFKSATQSISV